MLRKLHTDTRGYSLADVVTGMVLMSLVAVSMYQVMIPGFALWRNSDERIGRQQDVRLAIDRLARAIHESSAAFGMLRAYNCNPAGSNQNCSAFGFVTARDNTCTGSFQLAGTSGAPSWQATIYVWWDGASAELRQHCAVGATPAVTLPSLGTLTPFVVIGRRLSLASFTLCNPCSPVTPSVAPIAIALSIEEQAATASRPSYRYQTSFFNQTIFLPMNR